MFFLFLTAFCGQNEAEEKEKAKETHTIIVSSPHGSAPLI